MTVSLPNAAPTGRIARLSSRLINQIAAGEVVTRPAAALKEIIENALDAGATRLEITVEDDALGFTVRDDGSGMDEENLRLCVERYATSKIRELDDLQKLETRGFRGEALAAIASVSRLEITTRTREADAALRLKSSGGADVRVTHTAANPGTTLSVQALFFNTPARLKFLKNPVAEWGHMLQSILRQALTRADVAFAIRWRGKPYLDLPAGQTVADRLAMILPGGAGRDLLNVDHTLHEVRVHGAVTGPKTTRRDRRHQYFFANGRPILWRPLAFAFEEAYRGLLMTQHYPLAALLIELPGEMIDVNVHPTKDEVRFQQEALVSGAVHRAVGEALRAANLVPQLHITAPGPRVPGLKLAQPEAAPAPPIMQTPPKAEAAPPPAQGIQLDFVGGFALNQPNGAPASPELPDKSDELDARTAATAEAQPEAREEARLLNRLNAAPAAPRVLGQVGLTYLLAEAPRGFTGEEAGGMLVIDQHAAHEKILYMQFMAQAAQASAGIDVQPLLIPHQLELAAGEAAALETLRPALAAAGFEVEPFGERTYLVQAIPAIFERLDVPAFLRDLIDDVGEGDLPRELQRLRERICARAACRAAVKAGDELTQPEMQRLLEQLLQTTEALRCPHGRPTVLLLTRASLDRQFGRLG